MSKAESELQHEDYSECYEKWRRAREVVEGEDTIKAAGERYLPKLDGQTSDEFNSYVNRTKFLNATGRTLDGLHGMIFRKEPIISNITTDAPKAKVEDLLADVTMKGQSVVDYAQSITSEVLLVARGGTLVDYVSEEKRSVLCFYSAENIWNWRTERVNGKMVLTMLLLHEDIYSQLSEETLASEDASQIKETTTVEVEQLRLLMLTDKGYEVRLYQKTEDSKKQKWKLTETIVPVRNGLPLQFIPWVFHKPKDMLPCCAKLPLEDIITVNLHHYRISADYNHGLHFTALPTAYVTGMSQSPGAAPLKIGSTTAWLLDNPQAKAGFLEFTGQGLNAIKDAIEDDKKDMAIFGGRLLEEQKRDAETAETQRIRQTGESSILSTIATTTGRSITQALKFAIWWMGTTATPNDVSGIEIQLNTDFTSNRMPPEEITALVNSWIRGAISRETMLWNFQEGEVLKPGRTVEEEIDAITEDATILGKAADGRGEEEK